MTTVSRPTVKRNFRSQRPPVLFVLVQNILTEMALYPLVFTTPKVTLAVLLAALNQTIASYNKHLHSPGLDTTIYNTDMENLYQLMFEQADYVDDIADGNQTIILQSGFKANTNDKTYHKNDEKYTQGVSGTVHAVIKKKAGATGHIWQYCVYDPTGTPVWILADCTKYAKFSYTGLIPGTTYLFRYCPTINNTLEVWSNPYKMIVT